MAFGDRIKRGWRRLTGGLRETFTAPPVPEPGRAPTLELSDPYAAERAQIARQGAVRGYARPGETGQYVRGLFKSLGVDRPEDITAAERGAVMGELSRSAHAQAVADAAQAAQTGMTGSAAEMALASRRSGALTQARREAEADLQREKTRRLEAYREALLGEAAAQRQMFGQEADRRMAWRQQQEAMLRGLSGEDIARQEQLYQFNQLLPYQTQEDFRMAQYGRQADRVARNMQLLGMGASLGLQAAGAGIGASGGSRMPQ